MISSFLPISGGRSPGPRTQQRPAALFAAVARKPSRTSRHQVQQQKILVRAGTAWTTFNNPSSRLSRPNDSRNNWRERDSRCRLGRSSTDLRENQLRWLRGAARSPQCTTGAVEDAGADGETTQFVRARKHPQKAASWTTPAAKEDARNSTQYISSNGSLRPKPVVQATGCNGFRAISAPNRDNLPPSEFEGCRATGAPRPK